MKHVAVWMEYGKAVIPKPGKTAETVSFHDGPDSRLRGWDGAGAALTVADLCTIIGSMVHRSAAREKPSMDIREIVVADPEIMGGVPCFRGTRIPIATLFENLADGMSLDELFEHWPTLDRDDVRAVLSAAQSYVEGAAA